MLFSKKQAQSLISHGIDCKIFFLASRTFSFTLFQEIVRFRRELKSFKPDIVHSQYGTMTAFFSAFLSFNKFVITFQGSDLNKTYRSDGYLSDFLGRMLSNIALLRASGVICVSKSMLTGLWWRRDRAVVIPVGVDTQLFFPMDKLVARRKINWKEDEKVVLFNSNNPAIKRLDIAKEAVKILKNKNLNIRLEALDGNVNPDIIPFYVNAADCLLLCSDSEGSPMIIKESLACNLPIVTVDVGDAVVRIEGVSNCRVVNQNPLAIAKEVDEIISLNQRTDGRSKLIADGLTEKDIAKKIIGLYESLL